MLADLGLGLNDLGTIGAFHPVLVLEDLGDGQIGKLLDLGMVKFMGPDRVDASQIVKLGKQFTGPVAASQVGFFIGYQKDDRFQVFLRHTGVELGTGLFFILVAAVAGTQFIHIDNAAGKGIFAADHHRPAFLFVGEQHVAAGSGMAVLFFKLFPAILENRTVVVKTDENQFGTPAQSITNVIWRGVTAGELFVAVRAIMFLPGYFIAALIHKHFESTSGKSLKIP